MIKAAAASHSFKTFEKKFMFYIKNILQFFETKVHIKIKKP